MYKPLQIIVFSIAFIPSQMTAQEDRVRFFDLETRPTISVLYDQTFKRNLRPIYIPTNIYATSSQRRNINMAEQVQRKESERNYLAQIYQSRINQQQIRISQNYKSGLKKKSMTTEAGVDFRQPYNYQPYGWQNNYYHSSAQWNPTFYQGTSYGRLRANRYLFY
ncbi:hypothetical protein [Psychroflexus planctonicus]|uniref:DUF3300 domain-containing protein n=1 Tax=Psychroflexus planctonicus TaxID=1526575 RepID=A0ABQ1SE78_9FLAO|nr:hypothetical protein [Psychroflexus planctonicus]GGE33139.1 hypothetical protein GCM10010832_11700 [Psychroflexus planctonicus]